MSVKAGLLLGSSFIAAVLLVSGPSWSQNTKVSDSGNLALLEKLVASSKSANSKNPVTETEAVAYDESTRPTTAFDVIQSVQMMNIVETESLRQVEKARSSAKNLQHAKARLKDFLARHEEIKKTIP
jgi:hypothetical protein